MRPLRLPGKKMAGPKPNKDNALKNSCFLAGAVLLAVVHARW